MVKYSGIVLKYFEQVLFVEDVREAKNNNNIIIFIETIFGKI